MMGSSICQPNQAPKRGEQLEVAVAHAFLAREQLEDPVDAPQAQVAGHRADDAVARRDRRGALGPHRVREAESSPIHSSG